MRHFEILEYLEDNNLLEDKNLHVVNDQNIIKDMVEKNLLEISMSDIMKLEYESLKSFNLKGIEKFYDIVIASHSNKKRIMYGLYIPKKYKEIEDFYVDLDEYKNYKRIKLINKMLYEKY